MIYTMETESPARGAEQVIRHHSSILCGSVQVSCKVRSLQLRGQ